MKEGGRPASRWADRKPHPRSAVDERGRRDSNGSALVEALVALVLIALAGSVVAAAAAAGLRATRQAAILSRTATLAGRELSSLASRAAAATAGSTALTQPGFPGTVQRTTTVEREGAIAVLTVRIDAERPSVHVGLGTRVLVDE